MVNIKDILPKKELEKEKEYYWSLIIEPEWVQASIWRIELDKAQVFLTSNPFSWESDEDLIQSTDSALSSLIQSFPDDLVEPSKTVFGVISSWVKNGQISEDYLERIKKLCSELELSPIGFVVIPEAISFLYKSEEGNPLNAVVIGVHKEILEITIFSLGKLLGTTQVARSVSLIDDVAEGISRFSEITTPPSRFLIYDGRAGELEEVRQELLKVNWEDFGQFKFLHTPKVEIVDAKRKSYAISLAGASELADIKGLEIVGKEEKTTLVQEVSDEEDKEKQEVLSVEKIGFVKDKDIEGEIPSQRIEGGEGLKAVNPDRSEEEITNFRPADMADYLGKTSKVNILAKIKAIFSKLGTLFRKIKIKKPKFSGFTGKSALIWGLIFIVVFFISGFALWWFYPKSTVTIYLSPQSLSETIDLSVGTDEKTTEASPNYIQGKLVEKTLSGEKSKSTSGTKTVGDKAKGEVTIYRVGTQINLNQGTAILGPGNLKFVLDGDVYVASGSASSPGETKTQITAVDIGAQYNLASGSNFSVGNFAATDLEAKNDSAFSGGSSREITAVSENDQEILRQDLGQELKDQAKADFKKNLQEGEYFIDESLTSEELSVDFNKKVGDEADTVKISEELKVAGLVVNKSDLISISYDILKGKIPQGFVFRESQVDFGFEKSVSSEDKFKVRVYANLLPEVKTQDISGKIRGKYPSVAEEYLRQAVPGFTRVEIKIKPTLPGKLKTLPHVEKNIDVEISSEK